MMHIYSLQVGEGIRIGDESTATVVAIKGGNVRLGISARSDILIYREEIVERCEDDGWLGPNQPTATEVEAGPELPKQGPRDPVGPETNDPGIS